MITTYDTYDPRPDLGATRASVEVKYIVDPISLELLAYEVVLHLSDVSRSQREWRSYHETRILVLCKGRSEANGDARAELQWALDRAKPLADGWNRDLEWRMQ